ncbi:MAG: OmpA family protein [Spirochaetes bacterium]|nr:OmpA family protein [Spirochaetota bacterium]
MSDEGFDPNAWMITFADLVMLLLTFFVLLLTMSSMDTKKLKSLMTHFRESTGVLQFSGAGKVSPLASFVQKYNDSSTMLIVTMKDFVESLELAETLEDILKDNIENVRISDDERGIVLSFSGDFLFDSGKAAIKKEIFPILDALADTIYSCPNDIMIMGSTDNIPINSNLYKSNWELSVYRGLPVLEYFLKEKGLPPSRFYAGGYGSSRPLYPNDTPKNRSSNRRVEIIFKHLKEG